jgi:hypothetical protein
MGTTSSRSDERWLRSAKALAISAGILGTALVTLGIATVWTTGWGKDLFAPGAALVTVGMTAYIAVRSLVTWSEQRLRDREAASQRRREIVYEGLVQYMTSCFTLDLNPLKQADPGAYAQIHYEAGRQDANLRSSMLAWADEETLEGLARWRQAVSDRQREQRTLPPEQWTNLEEVYGDTVLLLRKSLIGIEEGSAIDREVLLAAMFDGRSLTPVSR